MVVCKFFLQGYCKYGSRCRFEHSDYYDYNTSHKTNTSHTTNTSYTSPLIGNYSNDGRSVLRSDVKINQNVLRSQNSTGDMQSQVAKSNLHEVLQIASRDILQHEKGNQWPLTCYSPLKEYGNLPGWDDHSPEEIRWESYKASKNGTFSTCQQAIENIYKIAQDRRLEMKNKEKATSIIDNIMRNARGKPAENGNLQWAGQNNSSVFNTMQPGTNTNTTPFATSESPFASHQPNTGNVGTFFGASSSAFGPSSNFSTAVSTHSDFGSASTTFGPAPSPIETEPPIFGSAPSGFGSGSPTFGTAGQPFGPESSVSDAAANVFGAKTVTQTSFVFSLDPQVKPTENTQSSKTEMNSFKTSQSKPKDTDESFIYSAIDTLAPHELSAFESQTFVFRAIPLKPPPKSLCGF